MPQIEGFRVRNYGTLMDVALGKLPSQSFKGNPLSPLTVVIGKNGVGKSTLFDAFGFLADCLKSDVETACDEKGRGGFERLRSKNQDGPISFELYYRENSTERPITYELDISLDPKGRPFVARELLRQRRKGQKKGQPFPFLKLEYGKGAAWAGEDAIEGDEESNERVDVILADPRRLGIVTYGALREHPRITKFCNFLRGWYLSYFTPDAARGLPMAGPQKHLNIHGDNLGNVVQYMQREHPKQFDKILEQIATKIPGITKIEAKPSEDGRILLRFNDGAFKEPFLSQHMSDGTLKIFAYLLLLHDPEPPPFICLEEPENGLYHKLLNVLAEEFRTHAMDKKTQILITTHQPCLVDALTPEEVWILEKGTDGFSTIHRASDSELIRNMAGEFPLGSLWYSDYFERS